MNDVIVVGAAHATGGRPRSKSNVKGDIRGFDVRTGAVLSGPCTDDLGTYPVHVVDGDVFVGPRRT